MKKSSSLESLQTMVQEVRKKHILQESSDYELCYFFQIQMQEEGDPAYSYRGPSGALKVIRGRGCEESFRAAVVDPNHRSEIGKYMFNSLLILSYFVVLLDNIKTNLSSYLNKRAQYVNANNTKKKLKNREFLMEPN